MKIRIKNNTVRYRLDQLDVENIKSQGFCEEKTQILDQKLLFSIRSQADKPNSVLLNPFHLETTVQAAILRPVLDGSQIGITFTLSNPDGTTLKILIERDFKCLIPRGEDDQHAFENPLEGTGSSGTSPGVKSSRHDQ